LEDLLGTSDPHDFATWFTDIHPDDLPRIVEANRRSLESGVPFDEQLRFFNSRQGKWIWAHIRSTPVCDSEGKLAYFNGLIVDVTKQKQAEQALQERLAFEQVITSISTEFINLGPDEIDAGILHALQVIGDFTGDDRSYVFRFSEDGTRMDNTHEWCRATIEPQIHSLQAQPVEILGWSVAKIRRLEVVHIPGVAELPSKPAPEQMQGKT
jgi:hypothetical protein